MIYPPPLESPPNCAELPPRCLGRQKLERNVCEANFRPNFFPPTRGPVFRVDFYILTFLKILTFLNPNKKKLVELKRMPRYAKRTTRRKTTTRTRRTKIASISNRRTNRRRRTRAPKSSMAPRTLGFAIQPRKFTKVSWTGSYNQTLAVGQNSTTTLFRANSIYDPDYSNVSKNTSVNGYYLSSVIYQRYRVFGVKADYIVYNNSVTIGQAALVAGNETGQYATTVYVTDLAARNGVKSKILPPGSGNKPVYISKYFNCADIVGDVLRWRSFMAMMGRSQRSI